MISVAASLFIVLGRQEPDISTKFTIDSVKNQVVKGSVVVSLPAGWHAYQNPPKDKFENPLTLIASTKGLTLSKISYPKGEKMTSFGNETLVYMGDVKIPFEAKIGKTIKPKNGSFALEFEVSYQICNDSTCKPPASIKATVNVKETK